MQRAAAMRITDDVLLGELACQSTQAELGRYATRRISDRTVLEHVKGNGGTYEARKEAGTKLKGE